MSHQASISDPTVRLLSSKQVATLLSIHVKTFQRYIRETRLENFPPARTLVGDVKRWISTEVEDWVRRQKRKLENSRRSIAS